jgi:hypothetical protein
MEAVSQIGERKLMFHLHDTTRRQIGIFAFALFCLLPTLLVAGWCVRRHLPDCAANEAGQLAACLGLDVKLAAIKYPRPGAVLYEQVELADPEIRQTIFRCRLLEVGRTTRIDERGQRRPTVVLTASQPRLEAAAIGRGWQWFQDMLKSRLGKLDYDVQLSATEVTLQAPEGSQTLTNVDGVIEPIPDGIVGQVHFRLAGADTPEPLSIAVKRNRRVSPPETTFELYTGDGELPCNVLATGISELRPLGPRCRFRGRIWATEKIAGWEGEITGHFVDFNLGNLVTGRFPNRLSGVGELTVDWARFREGRLQDASAILTVGPGTIERSLIYAAVEHLGLSLEMARLPERPRIEYRQLAMIVQLNGQGLHISGFCKSPDPSNVLCKGTVLTDVAGRPLLSEPRAEWQPFAALANTLAPESILQVPHCLQTDWLLRHAPVPEVIPPRAAEPLLPAFRPNAPRPRLY